jgi:hypothetical protein
MKLSFPPTVDQHMLNLTPHAELPYLIAVEPVKRRRGITGEQIEDMRIPIFRDNASEVSAFWIKGFKLILFNEPLRYH